MDFGLKVWNGWSIVLALFWSLSSSAIQCSGLFSRISIDPSANYFEMAIAGKPQNAFALLLDLENRFNAIKYQRKIRLVQVEATSLPRKELVVLKLDPPKNNDSDFPSDLSLSEFIEKLLNSKRGKVNWLHHPFNTASYVPFFYEPRSNIFEGYLSASRSLFFEFQGHYFSVRMPTDHPRGDREFTDHQKTEIASELDLAEINMKLIQRMDQYLNWSDSPLLIAPEIAIVKTKNESSSSGFMFRSLDFLKNDSSYYVPAFSIPIIGEIIAKKHNKSFNKFWAKHYAEALGKVQVHLLLKYGLQMDYPHGQNILIETDKNFMPTGRFVLRDIDDMSTHQSIARVINKTMLNRSLPELKINNNSIKGNLNLEYLWTRFAKKSIERTNKKINENSKISMDLFSIFVNSYIKEMAKILNIHPDDIGSTSNDIESFLQGTWGQQVLQNFYSISMKQNK